LITFDWLLRCWSRQQKNALVTIELWILDEKAKKAVFLTNKVSTSSAATKNFFDSRFFDFHSRAPGLEFRETSLPVSHALRHNTRFLFTTTTLFIFLIFVAMEQNLPVDFVKKIAFMPSWCRFRRLLGTVEPPKHL